MLRVLVTAILLFTTNTAFAIDLFGGCAILGQIFGPRYAEFNIDENGMTFEQLERSYYEFFSSPEIANPIIRALRNVPAGKETRIYTGQVVPTLYSQKKGSISNADKNLRFLVFVIPNEKGGNDIGIARIRLGKPNVVEWYDSSVDFGIGFQYGESSKRGSLVFGWDFYLKLKDGRRIDKNGWTGTGFMMSPSPEETAAAQKTSDDYAKNVSPEVAAQNKKAADAAREQLLRQKALQRAATERVFRRIHEDPKKFKAISKLYIDEGRIALRYAIENGLKGGFDLKNSKWKSEAFLFHYAYTGEKWSVDARDLFRLVEDGIINDPNYTPPTLADRIVHLKEHNSSDIVSLKTFVTGFGEDRFWEAFDSWEEGDSGHDFNYLMGIIDSLIRSSQRSRDPGAVILDTL